MKTSSHHAKAIGWMCLAMLFWALIELVPQFLSKPYSPYQIVWTRYAIHILLMLVVFAPRMRIHLIQTPRVGWQIVRGLMMLGMPVSYILAVGRMRIDAVMAVLWISPFVVLALAVWLLGEKVKFPYWGFTLAAFAGMLLMLKPGGEILHWHVILSIGTGLCFAMYQFLTRMLREENTFTSLFYTALCVLIPLSFGLPLFWQTPTLGDVTLMAVIGLLGFGALLALEHAYETAQALVVAPFALAQPIWTMLAHVALGTMPNIQTLIGGVIIVGSGMILWRLNSNQVANYEQSTFST